MNNQNKHLSQIYANMDFQLSRAFPQARRVYCSPQSWIMTTSLRGTQYSDSNAPAFASQKKTFKKESLLRPHIDSDNLVDSTQKLSDHQRKGRRKLPYKLGSLSNKIRKKYGAQSRTSDRHAGSKISWHGGHRWPEIHRDWDRDPKRGNFKSPRYLPRTHTRQVTTDKN